MGAHWHDRTFTRRRHLDLSCRRTLPSVTSRTYLSVQVPQGKTISPRKKDRVDVHVSKGIVIIMKMHCQISQPDSQERKLCWPHHVTENSTPHHRDSSSTHYSDPRHLHPLPIQFMFSLSLPMKPGSLCPGPQADDTVQFLAMAHRR